MKALRGQAAEGAQVAVAIGAEQAVRVVLDNRKIYGVNLRLGT
jgi:hypothetical protein